VPSFWTTSTSSAVEVHNAISGLRNWQIYDSERQEGLREMPLRAERKVAEHSVDRLYVLRKQLVHGRSDLESMREPKQVRDGAGTC